MGCVNLKSNAVTLLVLASAGVSTLFVHLYTILMFVSGLFASVEIIAVAVDIELFGQFEVLLQSSDRMVCGLPNINGSDIDRVEVVLLIAVASNAVFVIRGAQSICVILQKLASVSILLSLGSC